MIGYVYVAVPSPVILNYFILINLIAFNKINVLAITIGMNVNKVILVGRMASDPETRSTPSGQQVTNFSIATNRVWKDRNTGNKQEQTEFHRIVAWGATADIAGRYLKKGQLVHVEGRLQTRSWEGKDGNKRYTTEVVVENLQLGPKAANSGGYQSDSSSSNSSSQNPMTGQTNPRSSSPSSDDDDIPVINEDSPTAGVTDEGPDNDVEKSDVDLKDIPF